MFLISEMNVAEGKKSKGESFLKGTFVLTIAGFVVKVIGSLNWIFVSRILGGEGIGLYQMAFPIYFFAMTVSQAGVPVAISIITAERVALKDIYGAKRVFRISMMLMVLTGLLFSILTYLAADWLIEWQLIRDARAYKAVVVLAPTVFFVTLLASSRGYLQGWQRMTPTAVSQIVEQIFRVVTMIVLASLLMPWGLDYAAAGASLGAFAGAVTGLIVLVYFHIKLERDIARDYGTELKPLPNVPYETRFSIIHRIFKLALPVSAASIMLPVVSNLDLMIVPQRLEAAGYSISEATELFGYLNGMAVPLVNLATILTASMAMSIVPAISESRVLGDQARVYDQTAASVRIYSWMSFSDCFSSIVCFGDANFFAELQCAGGGACGHDLGGEHHPARSASSLNGNFAGTWSSDHPHGEHGARSGGKDFSKLASDGDPMARHHGRCMGNGGRYGCRGDHQSLLYLPFYWLSYRAPPAHQDDMFCRDYGMCCPLFLRMDTGMVGDCCDFYLRCGVLRLLCLCGSDDPAARPDRGGSASSADGRRGRHPIFTADWSV